MWATLGPLWWMCCGRASVGYSGATLDVEGLVWAGVLKSQGLKI